ncbi:hypothetical protein [Deinococcus arenicola]|uniref:Serine/threonine protein kinase n=1 Tax=Deinococcus arenicola TaxID=2994950 RepID=A0ABU4DLN5_9DEIO|nr:hypothetical protein [Deinococcus sp. ZS9-10]MDV6373004.1 hypothetical protein [Deinococcus sp. ZS9-10]
MSGAVEPGGEGRAPTTRARVLTAVLAAILLVCAAAVYLDQQGFFEGRTTVSTPVQPTTPAQPPAPAAPPTTPTNTSTGDGYGELK